MADREFGRFGWFGEGIVLMVLMGKSGEMGLGEILVEFIYKLYLWEIKLIYNCLYLKKCNEIKQV